MTKKILKTILFVLSILSISMLTYSTTLASEISTTSTSNDYQNLGTTGILILLVLREVFEFIRKRDLDKKMQDISELNEKLDNLYSVLERDRQAQHDILLQQTLQKVLEKLDKQ